MFVLSLLVALVLAHRANAQTTSDSSVDGNGLNTACAAAMTNCSAGIARRGALHSKPQILTEWVERSHDYKAYVRKYRTPERSKFIEEFEIFFRQKARGRVLGCFQFLV